MIKARFWTNDTNMLVDIPIAEAVRYERATPDGRSGDVQQHIVSSQFRAAHFLMCFFGDVGNVIEPQTVEMNVLASQQRNTDVEIPGGST